MNNTLFSYSSTYRLELSYKYCSLSLLAIVLLLTAIPSHANGRPEISSQAFIKEIETKKGYARLSAIRSISKKHRLPELTPNEVTVILDGLRGSNRSNALHHIASRMQGSLNGYQSDKILGDGSSSYTRYTMIRIMAEERLFGDLSLSDATTILNGTKGSDRSNAVRHLKRFCIDSERLVAVEKLSKKLQKHYKFVADKPERLSVVLNKKYGEYYAAALGFRRLALSELRSSHLALSEYDIPRATSLFEDARRHIIQYDKTLSAANAAYLGKIEKARKLTTDVYKTARHTAGLLSRLDPSPISTVAVETVFHTTDFWINYYDKGLPHASKELLMYLTAEAITSIPLADFGGKSLSDFIGSLDARALESTNIHEVMERIIRNPDNRKAIKKAIVASSEYATDKISKEVIVSFLRRLPQAPSPSNHAFENSSTTCPTLPDCKPLY